MPRFYFRSDALLSSVLSGLQKLFSSVLQFLSPYIKDLIKSVSLSNLRKVSKVSILNCYFSIVPYFLLQVSCLSSLVKSSASDFSNRKSPSARLRSITLDFLSSKYCANLPMRTVCSCFRHHLAIDLPSRVLLPVVVDIYDYLLKSCPVS